MNNSKLQSVLELAKSIRERVLGLKLADANEAETRFHLIDEIVRNILGWDHSDIHVEERVLEDGKVKFVDYIIRTANTAIIIEAKRVGSTFELTRTVDRRVQLSPGFVVGDCGKAIIQARDYGRSKSIPFAVVTNGDQWVIFPASRADQIEFNKSTAIVFDSIESALGNDVEYFFNLLSRDGVIDGFLESELLGRTDDQLQERRLKNIVHKDGSRRTNPIYPLIENEVVDCFSDTISGKNKEFLELSYVPSPDRTKFDNRIKMHLHKRDSLFDTKIIRPMRSKESSKVKRAIEGSQINNRPLALLVLGSVGVGKTTYLNYTRQIVTADFFSTKSQEEYPHWIHVDLRMHSEGIRPIDEIYKSIHEYMIDDPYFSDMERCIRHAYKNEIESLKRGPLSLISRSEAELNSSITALIMKDYNDVKKYVDKLVKHASSKQPIFLVIDNVDQFDSEEFQGQVFADSISLASRLGVNLVLAMREGTFVKHRGHPSFDAFDFDPLVIEPPEISAVLSRRFMLLKKSLKGKRGSFASENGAKFNVDDLSIFADLVQQSVLGTEIGSRIEVLANKDIRLALRMTREFLERGYTDPEKAMIAHKKDGRYVLPRHEAFRAILLGNQNVYSEAYSVIGNPFDARLSKTSSQILRLFVLTALVKYGSDATAEYIEGTVIRDVCRKLGYSDSAVLKILNDLCALRFCQTASYEAPSFSSTFIATRLGGYIVRDLIVDFIFLEAVMMDTFIAHDGLWDNLKKLTKDISSDRDTMRRINLRVDRVKLFWRYMSDQYHLLQSEALRRSVPSEWCVNPFADLEKTFESNCGRVLVSAAKNYGRKPI